MPARVSTPTEPYSLVTKNTFEEKIKSLCTQKISHIKLVDELPDPDIQKQQMALLPRTYLAKDLKQLENKGKFTSPLLKFRSYRFSPYFRESCSIASATYTHKVDCNTPLCGYRFGRSFFIWFYINIKLFWEMQWWSMRRAAQTWHNNARTRSFPGFTGV